MDAYNPDSVYSVNRKLVSSYTGNAFEITRADLVTQDFGFTSNEVSASAIDTFLGAQEGRVSKWYDQSGNGVNVVQTTYSKMPVIDTSFNGKIAMRFYTSNASCMIIDPSFTTNMDGRDRIVNNGPFTIMSVANVTDILSGNGNQLMTGRFWGNRNNQYRTFNGSAEILRIHPSHSNYNAIGIPSTVSNNETHVVHVNTDGSTVTVGTNKIDGTSASTGGNSQYYWGNIGCRFGQNNGEVNHLDGYLTDTFIVLSDIPTSTRDNMIDYWLSYYIPT